jgi:hypothetical protein
MCLEEGAREKSKEGRSDGKVEMWKELLVAKYRGGAMRNMGKERFLTWGRNDSGKQTWSAMVCLVGETRPDFGEGKGTTSTGFIYLVPELCR